MALATTPSLPAADAVRTSSAAAWITALLVTLAGCLSVAFFFRTPILNGFTLLDGDRYDQVIAISIMEHWFNVFRGMAHWSETGYFYPVHLTLGYDDGFFLNGVIYSLFRSGGLGPYLSGECVNIVLRAVAYFGLYAALRRIFGLRPAWCVLAAAVFTISNNMYVQLSHSQLLAVGLVPVMAVLLDGALRALRSGQRRFLLAWGVAAAIFYAAWLLTGFYMAWYFLFFCVFLTAAYIIVAPRNQLSAWWRAIRRDALPLAVIVLVLIVANIPFLSVYLPKARETGMHPYSGVFLFTPSLLDVVHVGQDNLLWGRIVGFLNHALRPGFPLRGERMTGFPPVLLLLFACGAVLSFSARRSPCPGRAVLLRAMVLATLVTWALTIHIHSHSAWLLVFKYFPGAKAARVVSRYQIFLAVPVIAIAICYLSAQSRRIVAPVVALVCVLLLAGEVNTVGSQFLDRPTEAARLRAVPPPPAGCQAFFVSEPRPEPPSLLNAIYSQNTDAMLIAETVHLPTINGYATFVPPHWHMVNAGTPAYLDNVRDYAAAYHVTSLCSLDLRTFRWAHFLLPGSAH